MANISAEMAARAKRVSIVLGEISQELRVDGIRIKQTDIASSLDKSQGMISKWFSGAVAPAEENIPALAKIIANGNEGREKDYLERLSNANSLDEARNIPLARQEEVLTYALQLPGDLGLPPEKREALLKDRRLIASLGNYVNDKPVIDEAGFGDFAETIASDPVRVSALRLVLANLVHIGDPK